jgi:ABC-2 type transport system permease protein
MRFYLSLRKELLALQRSGRLLALAAVLLLFGFSSPFLARFTPEILKAVPGAEQFAGLVPEPTTADAVVQYIKNASQFGLLLAILLTMGAVAAEKDKGTAALILTKPLPRPVFILSKFTALALVFALAILVSALGAWYYTRLLFGALNAGAFLALNALLWLWMLVWVAATLFFSALSRSQALAAALAFGFMILLSLPGMVPAWKPALPDALIGWGAALALGAAGDFPWAALGVTLALIAAALAAACLVFRRQEL